MTSIPVAIPAELADTVQSVEITKDTPSDADIIAAMFRALVCIIGAALSEQRQQFDQLRYRGADDEDLAVISDWLIARGK
jgi:2-keto-3-deoxy-6-phosphogluconate aldolase